MSFYYFTAETLEQKYLDRSPMLKIKRLLDWGEIERILNSKKTHNSSKGGRPSYPSVPMFRAILLGQWHSLSDPELEYNLWGRTDFMLFCHFPDEVKLPDHSTLNRFRNELIQNGLLDELMNEINRQLEQHQIKIKAAEVAIVDATIIQTAGGIQKKSIEIKENGEVIDSPASKDEDAKWTIKNGHWHLGYKLHMRTNEEGFVEQVDVTPANAADVNHLESVLDDVPMNTVVYADKGYDSKYNRELLRERGLRDGIMRKSHRGCALSREDIERNKVLSKIRYRVEQSFAILHRKFHCKRASYFGLAKVKGQMQLKVMCLNLLKAANKIRINVPIFA